MKESKLTQKIYDNPNTYIYIGVLVLTVGILANMFVSAIVKPSLVESLETTGMVIGYILNVATAFMALLGLVIFTSSLTAKKEAKQKKIVRRRKKK